MAENRVGYFASPHKTATEFTTENAILPKGVTGTESDTGRTKCGDGVTAWNDLTYNPGTSTNTGTTNKFKPLTIGYAGDSISEQWSRKNGTSPIFWFNTLFYPCRTENVFVTSDPGTTSADLLLNQIEPLEALEVKPDVILVHTTQNDYIGSAALAEASALNVTTYCDRALAAGVNNIIVAGHPPKSGTDEPFALQYLNRILSSYADATEGVHFIDTLSTWREIPTGEDPADGGIEWRVGYSTDGTHPVTKAMFETGKQLVPILSPLVQSKDLQPVTASYYDDVNAPYNNVLGLNGLMLGTNGYYNGSGDINVAGATAGSRWEVTDGNGVTATPSIVIGDDGYNYQQLVLGGTATADQTITLRYSFADGVSTGRFIQEAILHLNDVVGVDSLRCGVDTLYEVPLSVAELAYEGDNKLHLTYEDTFSNVSSRVFTLRITIKNGISPTGTIKLGRVGVYRQVD